MRRNCRTGPTDGGTVQNHMSNPKDNPARILRDWCIEAFGAECVNAESFDEAIAHYDEPVDG